MLTCQYCKREMGNKGALAVHEKCCDLNSSKEDDVYTEAGSKGGKTAARKEYGLYSNFQVECNNCGKSFKVVEREESFPKKEVYYCSKYCARSFATKNKRDQINQKISQSLSDRNRPDLSRKLKGNQNARRDGEELKEIWEAFTCPVCSHREIVLKSSDRKFCSLSCFAKFNNQQDNNFGGGYREGSVTNHKSGWYNGNWYDSSWELAWAIFGEDHGVEFKRQPEAFSYTFKEEEYEYYPDFYLLELQVYIEIKNFTTKRDMAKWSGFPYTLCVLEQEDMKPILKYVRDRYGLEFWNYLYD